MPFSRAPVVAALVCLGLPGPGCGFGSQWNPGHGAAHRGHRHRRRRGRLARNDYLCQMLGYPWEELRTKDWTQDHPPCDLAADVEQFERVLNGETDGYSIDKRFIRKDGRVIDTKPEPRPQGEATENLIDTALAVSRDNLRDAPGKSVTPSIGTPCSTESSIALGEGVDRSEESKAILERIWRVYGPGGIPRSRDPLNK